MAAPRMGSHGGSVGWTTRGRHGPMAGGSVRWCSDARSHLLTSLWGTLKVAERGSGQRFQKENQVFMSNNCPLFLVASCY